MYKYKSYYFKDNTLRIIVEQVDTKGQVISGNEKEITGPGIKLDSHISKDFVDGLPNLDEIINDLGEGWNGENSFGNLIHKYLKSIALNTTYFKPIELNNLNLDLDNDSISESNYKSKDDLLNNIYNEFQNFQNRKLFEIKYGFEQGLSLEQVLIYAKKEFTSYQMQEIRKGLAQGLLLEQVSIYAIQEFSWQQMHHIRLGFEIGLSLEQISLYAKQEFNSRQMEQIKDGFISGLSLKQVKTYTKKEFDSIQMAKIKRGFINDIEN